jgi:hypothetical protein
VASCAGLSMGGVTTTDSRLLQTARSMPKSLLDDTICLRHPIPPDEFTNRLTHYVVSKPVTPLGPHPAELTVPSHSAPHLGSTGIHRTPTSILLEREFSRLRHTHSLLVAESPSFAVGLGSLAAPPGVSVSPESFTFQHDNGHPVIGCPHGSTEVRSSSKNTTDWRTVLCSNLFQIDAVHFHCSAWDFTSTNHCPRSRAICRSYPW